MTTIARATIVTAKGAQTHLSLILQTASFDEAGMEAGYQFGWSAALDNLAKEFAQ
ncbi:MAG: hypothetical protein JNL81_17200 [Hyphomonadaceae bacterium]|nr:hypothetical protein [Hyphomonadaceae bacterium]